VAIVGDGEPITTNKILSTASGNEAFEFLEAWDADEIRMKAHDKEANLTGFLQLYGGEYVDGINWASVLRFLARDGTGDTTYHEVFSVDHLGNVNVDGNLTLGGTVDGRDIAIDGATLDNLSSQVTKFLGTYVSLVALQTAHPTASDGNYADVDAGVGSTVARYIWDSSDSSWILQGAGGSTSWGSIAGTLADQTDLKSALDDKVDDSQVLTDVPAGAVFTDTVYDDSTTTKQGNTFNGNSQLVKTDGDGKLPAVDGSQLTNLPSSGGGIGEFIDTSIAISSDGSALANDDGTDNENIGIGTNALTSNVSGFENVALGQYSQYFNTSNRNTSIGAYSMQNVSTGINNFAGGYDSLKGGNTKLTGSYNSGIGYQTGYNLTTGQYNVLNGYQAGYSLTSGEDNILIGKSAGKNRTTGKNVVAIGANAGEDNNTWGGVFIGHQAGKDDISSNPKLHIAYGGTESLIEGDFSARTLNINGSLDVEAITVDGSPISSGGGIGEFKGNSVAISSDNSALANDDETDNRAVAIGASALASTISQLGSVGVGYLAGKDITGRQNTAIGYYAGSYVGSGQYNTALGSNALQGNVTSKLTGSYNIGIGYQTGYQLTSGANNFLAGYRAGYGVTTGIRNIALGQEAMFNTTTGNRNIALGEEALKGHATSKLTGSFNTGIGHNAGLNLSTGQYNVLNGYQAGYALTSGSYNTILGYTAGLSLTTGATNTLIGMNAGRAITSGTNNTMVGKSAGFNATGSTGVFLGYNAGYNDTASNKLHIANNSTESLIGGDFSARTLEVNGDLSYENQAMVLLQTIDVTSSVASVDFTDLEATYRAYKLVTSDVTLTSAGIFRLYLSEDNGVTFPTNSNNYNIAHSSNGVGSSITGRDYHWITSGGDTSNFAETTIYGIGTTRPVQITSLGSTNDGGTFAVSVTSSENTGVSKADAIRVGSDSNILTGVFSLYGIKG